MVASTSALTPVHHRLTWCDVVIINIPVVIIMAVDSQKNPECVRPYTRLHYEGIFTAFDALRYDTIR